MKQLKSFSGLSFLIIFGFTSLKAQQTVLPAGGNGTGSGGLTSYSIGQLVNNAYTGTNGSVAEGVQQPYEISVLTGVKEFPGINLSFQAYPNPTSDFIKLEVVGTVSDVCYVALFDANGKLLSNEKLIGNEKILNMANLKTGNYFMRVVANQSIMKSFKIIKK